MTTPLIAFLGGAVALAYVIAGTYFLRFWRRTRDMLFAAFASAFWLLAVGRVFISLAGDEDERTVVAYGLRVLAHLLILYGIVGKNLFRWGRTGDVS